MMKASNQTPSGVCLTVALVLLMGFLAQVHAQSPPEDEALPNGSEEDDIIVLDPEDDGDEVVPVDAGDGAAGGTDMELGEVVVTEKPITSSLERRPERIESITAEELSRRGVTDLATAMQWISAGADSSPTGTSQGLIVDGLPTSQLIVLRDGLPISRPSGSPSGPITDLASIPVDPATIERIDVYRGLGPAGSAGAGGVIIDVVTRRDVRPTSVVARGQFGASEDTLVGETYALSADASLGDAWQLALLGQVSFADPLDPNGDLIPDTPGQERMHGEAMITWRPGQYDLLRLSTIATENRTDSLGGPAAVLDDRVVRQEVGARLQGRWRLSGAARLEHNTSVTRNQSRFFKLVRSSGFERPKNRTTDLGVRQTLVTTWWTESGHELALEAGASASRVERTGETGDLEPVNLADVGVGGSWVWFASEDFEWSSRAFIDTHNQYGAGVSAQTGVAVGLTDNLSVRTSVSRSLRRPTAEELFLFFDHSEVGYRVEGNPNLQPETLHSARLGLILTTEKGSWGTFGFEVEGFYHHLRNIIINEPVAGDPSLFTYANRARAHAAGFNATAQWRGMPGGMDLLATYAFLPISHDLDTDERLPQRSAHSARAEVTRRWFKDRLEVWGDVSWRSERSVPEGFVAAPAYTLLGCGAGWRFTNATRVRLDFNNLLDQTNATWGPTLGRSALLMLEIGHRQQ